ncbi:hypothetical protein [Dankookia sp. P2]|uniref:hypothetical protein n=1 Tax=Dankookia sp. P2 TaxID=3423955 RepID=UPI003D66C200
MTGWRRCAAPPSTAPMPRPWSPTTRRTCSFFDTEAERGTDPEVKAMAARHVPLLREHLRLAKALPRK